jgi:LytS/YehU family sensor histidine kinase
MKLLLLWIATAWAALDTLYRCLDRITRGRPPEWLPVSIEQFLGVYLAFALLPLVRIAADRHRWQTYAWALPVFSVSHTSLNWASRAIVFPLAGLGPYDYGAMPLRYLMELPSDIIAFSLAAVIRRQYLAWRRGQQAEQALAAARMELLTRQLQPHFLFNALNTVSALMREDVEKADRVLHRLCNFLRATIDLRDAATIPLARELDLLESYLDVMRARLEDNLSIAITVAPALDSTPVPPLFLQPLIENAIEHGRSPHSGRVQIELNIAAANHALHGALRDHGPGWQSSTNGYGLDAVRQRLLSLYGDKAMLRASDHPAGGALLEWSIPC